MSHLDTQGQIKAFEKLLKLMADGKAKFSPAELKYLKYIIDLELDALHKLEEL